MTSTRRTTLPTSRSFRPHNKSTLWDEFLEHPDKDKKYFNTKHKKAFCKRCIENEVRRLSDSQENRSRFVEPNASEKWEDWKFREAFGYVEAISGRSSNMQRHIRTCRHITTTERTRIMEKFAASHSPQTTSSSSMSQPPANPSAEKRTESAASPDHAAGTPSDNDSDSSYSIQSPAASSITKSQSEPVYLPKNPTTTTTTTTNTNTIEPERIEKRSPKFSLQSILNEVPDIPPTPQPPGHSNTGKNNVKPSAELFSPMHAQNSRVPPLPDRHGPSGNGGLIARLDHALKEINQVRSGLTSLPAPAPDQLLYTSTAGDSSSSSSWRLPDASPSAAASSDTLIAWLQYRLDTLEHENTELRSKCSASDALNSSLRAKLDRYRQRFKGELSDLDEDVQMGGTPPPEPEESHVRSRSAPTLFAPERDMDRIKKRKLDTAS